MKTKSDDAPEKDECDDSNLRDDDDVDDGGNDNAVGGTDGMDGFFFIASSEMGNFFFLAFSR